MTETSRPWMMRCKWCNLTHDIGPVTVTARYLDCSVWQCPGCGVLIDDRPERWGGTALPIDRPVTTAVPARCPNSCYTNGRCTCHGGR
jgi:hypothetical protein